MWVLGQQDEAYRKIRNSILNLVGTLRLYIKGEYEKIPVLSKHLQKPEELKRKAKRLSKRLRGIKDLEVHILRSFQPAVVVPCQNSF